VFCCASFSSTQAGGLVPAAFFKALRSLEAVLSEDFSGEQS